MGDHFRVPLIDAEDETLPVAAVARRLGVAPATLRTWDRRYGMGPRAHTTGRHRRYTHDDIARLEVMQQVLLRGATPAEAAGYALRTSAPPEPAIVAPSDGGASLFREFSTRSSSVLGLSRAAMAMDAVAAQRLISDGIEALGVVAVWDGVVRPVLAALASRWELAGECVEIEHFVHECALAAMIGATPVVATPRNPRPVLLCCAPDEQHSLPLYVLRAALARDGIGTQMLGAALPTAALASAVRRTGPAAVAVWAQLPRHADAEVFEEVPRTRQRVRLFACGPGWFATELPDRVDRLDDLSDALHRIETLVGVTR
ncbi:MerR family transcriptional regulator [Actinophytocola oryzae]|uniref:MerR-like DNA binding protein n=1 Tax=Actinophytocola oryzae TaxID=502181 RepID=A0A4R7UX16_9PSEU|nr:MerR family transcriptional regulator [Actinophytocola oryzae]TDV41339.1 MerR-like DNA binding protein [Actinophytocola oryzae]